MAGDNRKRWAPIAACPTCNEDADLCPHDQERDMTSPTQRRHDELRDLLTEIRDRPPFTYTIEARTCRKAEPVEVTEEPHRVHDHGIDPTCRERVGSDGLLRGECIDTAPDVDPDDTRPASCCGKCPPISGGGYDCTCDGNPRCVDPDEALARALYENDDIWGEELRTAWPPSHPDDRKRWLAIAREARGYIEAEREEAYLTGKRDPDRAEQLAARVLDLEADVLRLTRERDEAQTARDREANRYEALRASVEGLRRLYRLIRHTNGATVWADLSHMLDRDDRGRDA